MPKPGTHITITQRLALNETPLSAGPGHSLRTLLGEAR